VQQAGFAAVEPQLIAVVRVGDGDEAVGALAETGSA
jgi:hypothetical protein